jgi:hypothetical protein
MVTLLFSCRSKDNGTLHVVTNFTAGLLYRLASRPTLERNSGFVSARLLSKTPMKMIRTYLLLFFLCAGAAPGSVLADDGRDNRERSNGSRVERKAEAGRQSGGQGKIDRQGRFTEDSGKGQRHGRMTADERRALRRQIDEAGSELYRSRR